MGRDPRYDILFEPLKIGPVTIKNRFYQVPHCTGMGWLRPQTLAAMREVKAEGGWGAVCTEYNSIHPSSDNLPYVSAALWNDDDARASALMTEKVHAHGALAGAELWYGGMRVANYYTREPSMDIDCLPADGGPMQTRAMDKTDIRNLRRWHRKAAMRARDAGFDIVYVYATHGYLLSQFLNPRMNHRGDEYGGSLENRTRLVRELISETKDAVGDRCAIAVRFAADDTIGEDGVPEFGERREMFAMMADMPDLWDINVADYDVEMGASRFVKEAALDPYLEGLRSMTNKPVVTVGRFTSPDTMVRQIRQGLVDLIGAARPSIADPFLPKKIEQGRFDEIRECIGCNICYSGDSLGVPIRCTQNPTMGEEWRKGWHPERMQPKRSTSQILVVGAGPAGLEAARALGLRGYNVTLAEAGKVLGGRVTREATLPGMSEYIRVRDYREQHLHRLPNVEVYRESNLTAEDVIAFGADHVVLATGARWRRERFNGTSYVDVAAPDASYAVFTPDDIMDGRLPTGPAVLFDGDGYYMAVAVAERLARKDVPVTLVTASDSVAPWAGNTAERWRMRSRLQELGVIVVPSHSVQQFDGTNARLACEYSGVMREIPTQALVMVSQRRPNDDLYREILDTVRGDAHSLPFSLTRIGDCEAPGIVAAAVYSGHRYAQELEQVINRDNPMRHEHVALDAQSTGTKDIESKTYLETLLLYYEEEIMGDAYFRELSNKLEPPDQREKMIRMADVEVHAAKAVRPLIERHGLTPRPTDQLEAMGRDEAAEETMPWDALIARMAETYPAYLDDFRGLEALAPAEDLPRVEFLTEHEIVAIDFLNRELAGDADSMAPLDNYLASAPPA
ncbi:MAG: FAD-dependent oxidoreductase [Pseudomonadota bacterium]